VFSHAQPGIDDPLDNATASCSRSAPRSTIRGGPEARPRAAGQGRDRRCAADRTQRPQGDLLRTSWPPTGRGRGPGARGGAHSRERSVRAWRLVAKLERRLARESAPPSAVVGASRRASSSLEHTHTQMELEADPGECVKAAGLKRISAARALEKKSEASGIRIAEDRRGPSRRATGGVLARLAEAEGRLGPREEPGSRAPACYQNAARTAEGWCISSRATPPGAVVGASQPLVLSRRRVSRSRARLANRDVGFVRAAGGRDQAGGLSFTR